MFDQRWFWFALAALLFTNFAFAKLLFIAAIAVDIGVWVVHLLRSANAALKARREAIRQQQELRQRQVEYDRAERERRGKELDIEVERAKRQTLLIEVEAKKSAAEIEAKNNALPNAIVRRNKINELIDGLDIPASEKDVLRKVVEKHLLRTLKGNIDELA